MQPVIEVLSGALKKQVVRCQQIYSGNSRVYEVQSTDGEICIAKFYPLSKGDKRDRLGVEYQTLSYLWQCGLRETPRPLYVDDGHAFALYEHIEGEPIPPEEITENDIAAAAAFAGDLARVARRKDSSRLPDASEACFSRQCYVASVHKRLAACERLEPSSELHAAAAEFIKKQFSPLFREVEARFRNSSEDNCKAWEWELPRAERTLSPSDFGFHNSIRRNDGRIAFVDFEYFGWDDPAKLIVDFTHHPAMKLSCALASSFRERIISATPDNRDLVFRVKALYPLLGLKWCLIMLNEFLPLALERRIAARGIRDLENTLSNQLDKAKLKLAEVESAISKGKDGYMEIDHE
jgi:hypothetical protein